MKQGGWCGKGEREADGGAEKRQNGPFLRSGRLDGGAGTNASAGWSYGSRQPRARRSAHPAASTRAHRWLRRCRTGRGSTRASGGQAATHAVEAPRLRGRWSATRPRWKGGGGGGEQNGPFVPPVPTRGHGALATWPALTFGRPSSGGVAQTAREWGPAPPSRASPGRGRVRSRRRAHPTPPHVPDRSRMAIWASTQLASPERAHNGGDT